MFKGNARQRRFVNLLLKSKSSGERAGDVYRVIEGDRKATLQACDYLVLERAGIVETRGSAVLCRAEASIWLRRALIESETPFSDQHRVLEVNTKNRNTVRNICESPLGRLVIPSGKAPAFLRAHHIDAATRFQRTFSRCGMRQRTTMSYSDVRVDENRHANKTGSDVEGAAMDAKREVRDVLKTLPSDCGAALIDICGFEKGFQSVESEHGWPRRSAKLVLRIALDYLCQYYGLAEKSVGSRSKSRAWMEKTARPTQIG